MEFRPHLVLSTTMSGSPHHRPSSIFSRTSHSDPPSSRHSSSSGDRSYKTAKSNRTGQSGSSGGTDPSYITASSKRTTNPYESDRADWSQDPKRQNRYNDYKAADDAFSADMREYEGTRLGILSPRQRDPVRAAHP